MADVSGVVVIGAGMAGLLAAAAAGLSGSSVTVVERDELDLEQPGADGVLAAQPRRGVPQGNHLHVLLHAGLTAIEQLLPGVRAEILGAGGVPVDTGDLGWLGPQGWSPTGRPAYEVVSATRPLVEAVVRRRVLGLPGVDLRSGVRVSDVRRTPAGASARWSVALADGTELPADVVVDASGRGSRLGAWLAGLGVGPAAVTAVDPGVGYASRLYALPVDALRPVAGVVVQPSPDSPFGGTALPVENGRWIVAAQGFGAGRPAGDPASMLDVLQRLPDPVLTDLVRAAEPVGDVHAYRRAGNLRHHYERLADWPDGLLAVGDSLCAFNPIYGQGISVAARQAVLLREALAGADGRPADVPGRDLLRRLQRVADLPWSVSAGADRGFPAAEDGRTRPLERGLGWWAQQVGVLAAHGDYRAQDALSRLYHLVGSPAELLAPALVAAAVRGRVVGLPPAVPRPAFPLSPARAG
ncbi:MAG TPA: hypothetical protein VKB14_13030 [Actinomycetales bacterium]|nr:hypothetical protein [Actinomycetales bacterium]